MIHNKRAAGNIVLAIVGLTVVSSTFVILLGICANVGLTFFKCPTVANTLTVIGNLTLRLKCLLIDQVTTRIYGQDLYRFC